MADHPIFTESIRRIRALLGETGLDPLQQQVLERLVHSSGDPGLQQLLRFSEGGLRAGTCCVAGWSSDPHRYGDGCGCRDADGCAHTGHVRALPA